MSISLVPLNIASDLDITITCLDTWDNILVVGTQRHGVLLFSLLQGEGQVLKVAHNDVPHGAPIKQLNALDNENQLFILSEGVISVYDISLPAISHHSTLYLTNVQLYNVCRDSTVPTLCLATKDVGGNDYVFYTVYICQRVNNLYVVDAKIDFGYEIVDLVISTSRLFIGYKSDVNYWVNSRMLSTNMEKAVVSSSFEPILKFVATDQLLCHTNKKTKVLGSSTKFLWKTNLDNIAVSKTHYIGVAADELQVINLYEMGPPRIQHIKQITKDPFKFITDKRDVYVASKSAIWKLSIPGYIPLRSSYCRPVRFSPKLVHIGTNLPANWPVFADAPQIQPTSSPEADFPTILTPNSPISMLEINADDVDFLAMSGIHIVADLAASISTLPQKFLDLCRLAQQIVNQKELKNHETNPEDPLEVIGLTKAHIVYLETLHVFTVRQFASMPKSDLTHCEELIEKQLFAIEAVHRHSTPNIEKAVKDKIIYGYLFLPARQLTHVLESRELKSPYILFQEYMDWPSEHRQHHAWRCVYDANKADYLRLKGTAPSDADILAYLCWKYASSIGKLDITAGPRAITFRIQKGLPSSTIASCMKINLTKLCTTRANLYVKHLREGKAVWHPVSAKEYYKAARSHHLGDLEHSGCVVTPTGTIGWDCLAPLPTN